MPTDSYRGSAEFTHVVPVAVVPVALVNEPVGLNPARYRECGGCLGAAGLLSLAASGYTVVERTDAYCWSLNRRFSVVIEDREGNRYYAIFREHRDPTAARRPAGHLAGRAPAF